MPEFETGKIVVEPENPLGLIEEDYGQGEITLLYNRQKSERHLLFAVIELLPPGIEVGPPLYEPQFVGAGQELNLIRWSLPVKEAVAWFKALPAGTTTFPDPISGIPRDLITGELDHEPAWPSVAYEEVRFWNLNTAFWGGRPGGSKINHLISLKGCPTVTGWSETQRERAKKWLASSFWIDLFARPVLWGSAHLVLPNPLFRALEECLAGSGKALALEVVPYPGRSLDGLTVTVHELRPTGTTFKKTIPVPPSGRLLLDLPHSPHKLGAEVNCPRRGLLYKSEATPFGRVIELTAMIGSGVREVHLPSTSRKRGPETYQTQMLSAGSTMTIGELGGTTALSLMIADRAEKERRDRSAEIGYRWFNGEVDAATDFLREIIRRATKALTIVDPYFGAVELVRFALANGVHGASIRVLTSMMHLRDGSEEGKARAKEKALLAQLKEIQKQNTAIQIEVRVMKGGTAPIHDRFLILDHVIWHLGSSLNDLGNRGTAAVRLPYAPETISDIESTWADSRSLEDVVADPMPAPTT